MQPSLKFDEFATSKSTYVYVLDSNKYAMQQAMNTLMGQMSKGNSPLNNSAFSPGSTYPFAMPPTSTPGASPSPVASQPGVTVDVSATKVEAAPRPPPAEVKEDTEIKKEPKRYAFVDVSPQEVLQKDPFESSKESTDTSPTKNVQFSEEVRKPRSPLSVEALEKMMEDPTVQKMVYPYLPEEMRNPTTFKWMLQNPQYRQQLEDMLNNMGGGSEWDNKMMDSLKNFDLSSPEVKQQFDQIGLTPEEVISKIMANPEVAMAFQNPRVQAAIMDCSQNPLSIAKYQNDKEVMDVFNKISELFPGVTGSP
ncbi:Heat shock chaperonin-binding [Macleaya cordata]|uniref:Protein TIC 40, chloroplastic n=1 Tax=Macleaya cordata TaxID=56857 RepID=A0A200R8G3_MACCD|nr:Heat shock chaperonin-binding [Macleaya cordata]